jgi:hypothetical protein
LPSRAQKQFPGFRKAEASPLINIGKEFPHGGMNEKGLVVELMWLSETGYPAADNRAGMNELQWIQYQLDNCSHHRRSDCYRPADPHRPARCGTASLPDCRCIREKRQPLNSLTVKWWCTRAPALAHPVLTNTVYTDAVQQFKGMKGNVATGNNSVDRFATACQHGAAIPYNQYKQNAVDYAFNILDNIAQGSYTKWRIVYDITARQVYFITSGIQERRRFLFRF